MMLKNSFWDRVKQNAKRRIWSYFINSLVLLILLPINALVQLNGTASREFSEHSEKIKALQEMAVNLVGFNVIVPAVIVILAVITGIQGYGYLHKKAKVDMYHSQPVTKAVRFWSIYINGVIAFFIPYIVSVCITVIEISSMGVMSKSLLLVTMMAVGLNIIFFMAVYAVAILVTILTGNLMTAVLGSGIVLFYCSIFTIALELYEDKYYMTCVDRLGSLSRWRVGIQSINDFSVIGLLIKYGEIATVQLERCINVSAVGKQVVPLALGTIATTIIITGIAYWLYGIRKAEMAGVSMAFVKTKSVIELIIGIPGALIVGTIVGLGAGDVEIFYVIGIILGAILFHIIVQLIYENDISKVFKKKWCILVVATVSLLFMGAFYSDILGYDSFVPKRDEVESAAYSFTYKEYLDTEYNSANNKWVSAVDSREYANKTMYYTDVDNIIELAKENYFAKHKGGLLDHKKNIDYVSDITEIDDVCYENCVQMYVLYRMKNGKEVSRRLYFELKDVPDAVKKLVASEEFKESYFQICNDEIINEKGETDFVVLIDDGVSTHQVSKELFAGLREAYTKDLEKFDYDMGIRQDALAQIILQQHENETWPRTTCLIYPEYTNTIDYLEKNGICKMDNSKLDEITQIEIEAYDSLHNDASIKNVYREPEEIKTILEAVELNSFQPELVQFRHNIKGVSAYLMINDRDSIHLEFKEGVKVPEFLKEYIELAQ